MSWQWLSPGDEYETLKIPFQIASGRTIFSDQGDERLRLQLFGHTLKSQIIGRVKFGALSFGPPGHAHGGVISYVLDEAMGAACWYQNLPSVAARLEIHLLQMTPTNVIHAIEAEVTHHNERRAFPQARLMGPGGELLCQAQAEFAILPPETIERFSKTQHDG